MSDQPKHFELSDHQAQQHDLQPGRRVLGHKITVTGVYFAKGDRRPVAGGAAEKFSKQYQEDFVLPPSESFLIQSNALSKILSSSLLADRLIKKDKDFRGIKSFVVTTHENVYEPKEDFEKRTKNPGLFAKLKSQL